MGCGGVKQCEADHATVKKGQIAPKNPPAGGNSDPAPTSNTNSDPQKNSASPASNPASAPASNP